MHWVFSALGVYHQCIGDLQCIGGPSSVYWWISSVYWGCSKTIMISRDALIVFQCTDDILPMHRTPPVHYTNIIQGVSAYC